MVRVSLTGVASGGLMVLAIIRAEMWWMSRKK